jgi:glutamate racemase
LVVGVFDSGVGGLTVAKSIIDEKLFDEVIYYGDTARVPYGTKDENTIVRYSLEAVEFFKNFNIDILLVACNTASSYALDEMRKVAPFEVVGVIEPGVLSITKQNPKLDSKILVIGTKATVSSCIYKKMLEEKGFCICAAC